MATKTHKKVTRETIGEYLYKGNGSKRPLMVSIHGDALEFRPKGCRKTFALPIGAAYQIAVKIEADANAKARRSILMAKRKGQPRKKPARYAPLRGAKRR